MECMRTQYYARKKVKSRLQWVAITVIYVFFFVVVPLLYDERRTLVIEDTYIACFINNGVRVLLKSKERFILK